MILVNDLFNFNMKKNDLKILPVTKLKKKFIDRIGGDDEDDT
jgi:hypothetical protein